MSPCSVHAARKSVTEQYGFSYMGPFGLNKKYILGETRLVKAKYTPFESKIINHLTGNTNHDKVKIRETTSVIEVPMTGVDGILIW
ncbi:hypothetical protein [Enterobacter bugandensis]|uniref:hypothetical protein n=1 Tax=Enterobacter bugandensis TaxID=881260 RepID=UPI0023627518|nr:hypothetical protein [Enterobacter bugandensis]